MGTDKGISFKKWGYGEPSNTQNDECIEIKEKLWNNADCNGMNYFVCEEKREVQTFADVDPSTDRSTETTTDHLEQQTVEWLVE